MLHCNFLDTETEFFTAQVMSKQHYRLLIFKKWKIYTFDVFTTKIQWAFGDIGPVCKIHSSPNDMITSLEAEKNPKFYFRSLSLKSNEMDDPGKFRAIRTISWGAFKNSS